MRLRLLPFLPYGIAAIFHLAILLAPTQLGSTLTKPFLMLTLLFGLLLSLPAGTRRPSRRHRVALLASIAILLSLFGDLLLEVPGNIGFLIGLGFFLLAHAAYLVLFLGPLRQRRIPLVAVSYAGWWLAFLLFLAPLLGSLVAVLAVYGLVLAASSAAALGSNRLTAIGALLFLVSDSLLALKLFAGLFFYPVDFVIMVFYIGGQGLIVLGIARGAQRLQASAEGLEAPVNQPSAARAVP